VDQAAVRELAREIVEGVAPEESGEFDSQADAWFADPRRASDPGSEGDGPLGFGLADIATSVVPTVRFVAQNVLAATTEVTAEEGIRRLAGRLGRGKREVPDDEAETPELDIRAISDAYGGDRAALRRAVVTACKKSGADSDLTGKIADQTLAILKL
jgi:hypothetical protein